MGIETLLMMMGLMVTSVVAQSGKSNLDLPCRPLAEDDIVDICYTLYRSNEISLNQAEKDCSNKHGANGRLVAIPDIATQMWLANVSVSYLNHSEQLWIGAKYSGSGWTWHGLENKPISFTNWATGQPVNGTNRCIYIEPYRLTSGQPSWIWKTDSCTSKKNFMCEYLDNRCGRRNRRFETKALFRMAGASNAPPHAWPWMVSIEHEGGQQCGGSLLTDRFILTAAHCVDAVYRTRQPVVVLGMHNLREPDESPYKIVAGIRAYYTHPNHTGRSNDIMLLEMEDPILFNHGVKPVCLPKKNQTYPSLNQFCVATGWGVHGDTSQCCPMWVAQRDTEQIDGRRRNVTDANSIYQCQHFCFQKKECVGINYHHNQPQGSRCVAIMSSSSQRYNSVNGVDHFSLHRECAGCKYIWTEFENRFVSSAMAESFVLDVESLSECQLNCSAAENCSSFNYQQFAQNGTLSRCELLLRNNFTHDIPRGDMSISPGTNYYEVIDFFLQDYDHELRQAKLRPVQEAKCHSYYRDQFDDTMICAGGDGADTCQGDSGGPLVCRENDGRWVVYGVTSWGDEACALNNKPGVYAKVGPNREWIDSIIKRKRTAAAITTTPGPDVEITSQDYNCNDKNPCTLENVSDGWRCFTTSGSNPNRFVYCTARGRCVLKDGSTASLALEEDVCYFAIRQMRRIASTERGTSGFRIRLGSGRRN